MNEKKELNALMDRSRELSWERFGKEVNFCHTSELFPAISITGSSCALNCKHCERILLKRLPGARTPRELKDRCTDYYKRGASGVLITGGCTRDAQVPLREFLPVIREIKEGTRMTIIAHTGLSGIDDARAIKDAGVDGVCLDVVGCEDTTEEIYGLRITKSDYENTLKAFERAGMANISPHVCVGLHHGELHHEEAALEIISCIKPSNVVITGLTGLSGTSMQDVKIDPLQYVRVMCLARLRFPDSYVSAGCARGTGRVREEIDVFALRAGVNNIAIPTTAAYEEAKRLGLRVNEYDACCSLRPQDLNRR